MQIPVKLPLGVRLPLKREQVSSRGKCGCMCRPGEPGDLLCLSEVGVPSIMILSFVVAQIRVTSKRSVS